MLKGELALKYGEKHTSLVAIERSKRCVLLHNITVLSYVLFRYVTVPSG